MMRGPGRLFPLLLLTGLSVLAGDRPALGHSGPPFPIVSSRNAGPYEVSVWTDPDSTDDGTAGGQFWVTVRPAGGATLPAGTRVTVVLQALDRQGPALTASAEPVAADPSQRFAALVMDHEGRFRVRVTLDGPLGPAQVEAEVDATSDLRPSPAVIALSLIPFLLIGLLWVKVLRAPAARARREAAERERARAFSRGGARTRDADGAGGGAPAPTEKLGPREQ